jgi:hypothetical protein
MALTQAQKDYFSKDFQQIPLLDFVTLKHSSFPDGRYDLVNWKEDIKIGNTTYKAANFSASIPSLKEGSVDFSVQFKISILNKQLMEELLKVENWLQQDTPILATFTSYKLGDYVEPIVGPFILQLEGWTLQNYTLTGSARVGDYINTAFPRHIFNQTDIPSLGYFQ